jgi:hypothetical protein
MITSNKPNTVLSHVRNMLFNNIFSEHENNMLLDIKKKVIDDNNRFAALVLLAIENCFEDIKTDMKKASIEINFIHNLPITEDRWNEEYFYNVELLDYMEKINDVARVKKVIDVLANINRAYEKKHSTVHKKLNSDKIYSFNIREYNNDRWCKSIFWCKKIISKIVP